MRLVEPPVPGEEIPITAGPTLAPACGEGGE